MTEHTITPPTELVEQWLNDSPMDRELTLATQAAQWGADQELEACVEWLVEWLGDTPVVWNNNKAMHPGSFLRNSRRPDPPSLKEQALAVINSTSSYLDETAINTIRKALEALPND